MDIILGLLAECFSPVIWWLILYPVVWLLSLPVILLMAPFRTEPYWMGVTILFANVHDFWKRQGSVFLGE